MEASRKVFIVDDDPDFADFVADVADGAGFEVDVHRSAKECLAALRGADPAVVVMDVVMPDMDGVELVQAIGKEKPTVPVIVMSGYDSNYLGLVKTLGQASGVTIVATLMKPFTADEMEIALDAALAGNTTAT